MKKFDLFGKVVLIGTPAEEGGGGKVKLLDMGAYDGLDACMMVHPGPGPSHAGAVGASLAIQVSLEVQSRRLPTSLSLADLVSPSSHLSGRQGRVFWKDCSCCWSSLGVSLRLSRRSPGAFGERVLVLLVVLQD